MKCVRSPIVCVVTLSLVMPARTHGASELPSCVSAKIEGQGGYVAFQTNPNSGRVAWGAYMWMHSEDYGWWHVEWFQNPKRRGTHAKAYPPHHSYHPKSARSGDVLTVTGWHHSDTNVCTASEVSALSRDTSNWESEPIRRVTALAEALADRIAEVVPDDVDVSVDGTAIRVQFRRAPESIDIESIVDQPGDAEDHIEAAVLMVLDDVQDLITETTASPWPHAGGASETVLHCPYADVVDGELRIGFGDPEGPVLALRPIVLEDLSGE